jgi:molybdenum ABC transporter molybdate-binding protein
MPTHLASLPRAHASQALRHLAARLAMPSLALLAVSTFSACHPAAKSEPLVVFCAAGLKLPVEALAKQYEAQYHQAISLQYGGSQTLLAGLAVTHTGDLFIPADDSYLDLANAQQLLTTRVPLAQMRPVLVVGKGNPKNLHSTADLQRDGLRLALPNADATAIGKLARNALADAWPRLASHAAVITATVNEVGTAMKTGSADAGFLWDSLLPQYPEVEIVELAELQNLRASVSVALLAASKQPSAAMRFARYLAAQDKGLPVFQRNGFKVVQGDPWAESPELVLYAGSMLRPAIEDTLVEFEKREGAHITRVYNGCGILVAQMKAGSKPDAYFACDSEFMKQVQDSFNPADSISQNELVILVQKGNPKGIADLRDLTKPGIRVGLGHEKQCAMGWITQRTLTEGGIKDQVMKNVTVQTPTGDMLVNQMQAGSLDAAVTYVSNAVGAGDKLDAVRIQGIKCSVATQPFAVAKTVQFKQLAERLHDALRSAKSKDTFEGEGFQWKAADTSEAAP